MNSLFIIIPFLFIATQDTTKTDTILRPVVSIFEQSKSEKLKEQFKNNAIMLDTIDTKLDSIIMILKKRKNDTLNLK